MIDKISKTSFDEENNKIDKEENFNEIGDDFKLILMGSYNTEKHSFMHDLLMKLKNLDEKYQMNKFDYVMRTSSNKKWDRDFIKEKFINCENKYNKLHLCGPVGFMEYMKEEFLAADKIDFENIRFT